jgi:hypothetical protein
VELLLSFGAAPDLAAADGRTPLFASSKYGKASCVRLLLTAAADADVPMDDGTTPLAVAAASGACLPHMAQSPHNGTPSLIRHSLPNTPSLTRPP